MENLRATSEGPLKIPEVFRKEKVQTKGIGKITPFRGQRRKQKNSETQTERCPVLVGGKQHRKNSERQNTGRTFVSEKKKSKPSNRPMSVAEENGKTIAATTAE